MIGNRFLRPAFLVLLGLFPGCAAVTLENLDAEGALDVRLDANARAYSPTAPIRLKFFVDMTNASGRTVSLERLRIELRAFREDSPDAIALRQSWTYRQQENVHLGDRKKITIPIVPEKGEPGGAASEFPLELLPEGSYGIVAVVNGRHASRPYRLRIARPDLEVPVRRT